MDKTLVVGTTVGLVNGLSIAVFDGTGGKDDYRGLSFNITGLVEDADYTWNSLEGSLSLKNNIKFVTGTTYQVSLLRKYFIDSSFFIGDIQIPNTDQKATLEKVNYFIEKYEPECLSLVLGTNLYNLLLSESSLRMDAISLGSTYQNHYDTTTKWIGLVTKRDNLIANYVYWFFQESSATHTTGVSTIVKKSEFATSVSPAAKMISAWNRFCTGSLSLLDFLYNSTYQYDELSACNVDYLRKINIFGI